MRLVLATRNRDKVREIREALAGVPLELSCLGDFPGIGEIVEDGLTLEDNARKKAQVACAATGLPALADDTGLEVNALEGRPGVRSSRFAGDGATYEDNVRKLLAEMQDIPPERRGAVFRCVVAFAAPGEPTRVVEGRCEGLITKAPRGKGGFGYDPVFLPEGSELTFAEMNLEQKNAISHRGRALDAARKLIERWLAARR